MWRKQKKSFLSLLKVNFAIFQVVTEGRTGDVCRGSFAVYCDLLSVCCFWAGKRLASFNLGTQSLSSVEGSSSTFCSCPRDITYKSSSIRPGVPKVHLSRESSRRRFEYFLFKKVNTTVCCLSVRVDSLEATHDFGFVLHPF